MSDYKSMRLFSTVVAKFALGEKDEVVEYDEEKGRIRIFWSDRYWPSDYEFDTITGELTMWEGYPC